MSGWAVIYKAQALAVFLGGEEARLRAVAWSRSWAGSEVRPVLASVGAV